VITWFNDRGGNGTANGTNNWASGQITLFSGLNVLTVMAEDLAGNVGRSSLTVNYITTDNTGPNLSITNFSDGQIVTTNLITVLGMASDANRGDNGISSVEINGLRASGDTANGSGIANWSCPIILNQGSNNITVVARDNSPNLNSSQQSITINYTSSISPIDLFWQYKANMPIARRSSAIAVYNNQIYVIGGDYRISHYSSFTHSSNISVL